MSERDQAASAEPSSDEVACPYCAEWVLVRDGLLDVHRAVGGSPCYGSRLPEHEQAARSSLAGEQS